MRALGYIMLVIGFLGIFHLASSRISHALEVSEEQKESVPRQETYTRKELDDAIEKSALATNRGDFASVGPGFFMLGGAIILDLGKRNRK